MMMGRRSAEIQEAIQRRKQASECITPSFEKGISDSSDHLKTSETVLVVTFGLISKGLLVIRMWLR